jgi:hypothetical protein
MIGKVMYAISALMAIRTKTGNYQRSDTGKEIRIRNQREIYLNEILTNYLKNK